MNNRLFFAAAIAVFPFATGCADMSSMNKQQIGTGIGAVTGAVLGTQVGKGTGRTAAIVGLGAAGAFIGNRIGKSLDDQDKQKLANATLKTAETGQPQTVVSADTGARIQTQVVASTGPAVGQKTVEAKTEPKRKQKTKTTALTSKDKETTPAAHPSSSIAPETVAVNEQQCRTVRQTVVLQDGKSESEDVKMCKGPDGWQAA